MLNCFEQSWNLSQKSLYKSVWVKLTKLTIDQIDQIDQTDQIDQIDAAKNLVCLLNPTQLEEKWSKFK